MICAEFFVQDNILTSCDNQNPDISQCNSVCENSNVLFSSCLFYTKLSTRIRASIKQLLRCCVVAMVDKQNRFLRYKKKSFQACNKMKMTQQDEIEHYILINEHSSVLNNRLL